MEFRHLRYFVVTAEEGGINRAAKRLRVATSAISRRIRDLERDLEVDLFERQRGKLRLSPAGQIYYENTKRILSELEQARLSSCRAALGEVGHLNIGFYDIAIENPDIFNGLHKFYAAYPDIKLNYFQRRPIEDALSNGVIDAAIHVVSGPLDEAAFDQIEVGTDHMMIAMPVGHWLAQRQEVDPAALQDEPFVWMDRYDPHFWSDRLLDTCRGLGFEPKIVQYATSQTVRLHLVSVGVGLTFTPASSAPFNPKVVVRPIRNLSDAFHWSLIWRRAHRTPVLDRLISVFAEREGSNRAGRRSAG